jgi:DNA helicase-2/ATP-dependent DNA helicase PcrA
LHQLDSLNPNLLEDLNPEQRAAVRHHRGPILILAGAGSGKTRVLTRRVANLVLEYGEKPESILAVTFTNKATQEMRERILKLLGPTGASVWIATFHSACLRILRSHPHELGFSPNFVVYDTDDCKKIIESILEEERLDKKRNPPVLFLKAIDRFKNYLISPDQAEKDASSYEERLAAQIYRSFQAKLRAANAMDFGDLLYYGVEILEKNPRLHEHYQRRLQFVLVDEFQDTNPAQYRWIQLLTQVNRNLLVVGDDDQSIYAFRGATIRNILDFEHDFPGATVVKLEQNYRSTKNILSIAHEIISRNKDRKDKKLWTEGEDGALAALYRAYNESEEAEFIAAEIAKRKGNYNEVAVFYRTNAQSRAIEDAFMRHGIPYRIFGGLKFYDRKEIKDLLAYLRLLVNPRDTQAFLRVVNTPTILNLREYARGRNISLLDAARAHAKESKSKGLREFIVLIDALNSHAAAYHTDALIDEIVEKSRYLSRLEEGKDPNAESRVENIRELQAIARSVYSAEHSPLENLQYFLDRVSLTSGTDLPQEERHEEERSKNDAVTLMTLHLAKGLEFPCVFLTGLEEGLIPHYKSIEDGGGAIEEERRLLYVGITRAMKTLYITRSSTRGMFASGFGSAGFGSGSAARSSQRIASRFASDLPLDSCEERGEGFIREYRSFEFEDEDQLQDDIDFEGMPFKKKAAKIKSETPSAFDLIKTADELIASSLASPQEIASGKRVTHPHFGVGTVTEIEGEAADPKNLKISVRFDKESSGRPKRLAFQFAKLALAE